MDFLKKWLKEEVMLFLWGWVVILLVAIFAMLAVVFLPDIAINLAGLFILFIIIAHVFLWFKYRK